MPDVTVIDVLMGEGKSSWIINLVNYSDENQRILVVVPYKNEYRRLHESTNGRLKMIDDDTLNKSIACRLLIEGNFDLVITHSLYKSLSLETLELLHEKGYVLIIDESLTVIEDLKVKQADIQMLISSKRISVDTSNQKVKWIGQENDEGSFETVKNACLSLDVYLYSETALIAILPEKYFKGFSHVFICTYLFEYQLIPKYFELYGITFVKKSLVEHRQKKYPEAYNEHSDNRAKLYQLIDINTNPKHNAIGHRHHSLSKSNLDKPAVQIQLKKNFNTYFKSVNAKSKDVMWTTFKSAYEKVKGDGYTKGFIECNKKASNDFQHKYVLMYGCNIFLSPVIVNFLLEYNIEVNTERYAISELLQWIWRSRIRNGEPIKLYLPSKRMRDALEKWSKYEL